ncbi:Site-specific recombinase XerC [Tistlia consotensis]|uniref:Site-specific recombinase XerC n=1 Tax=Tistlia consotensis USBA 355 TaxID=560819 RepID=A0A1Y6CRI0_9PROT|nr:Site-specific recombinase XerC [Tistlia consotensis USBA 355]SNS42902.1 Site-specific recombinase XerC [Tistlia consotensis]
MRHAFGGKARFTQSLGTEDYREAKRRAGYWDAKWRGEIDQARHGSSDPLERDARYFREALRHAPEEERELILDQVDARYQSIVERGIRREGLEADWKDDRIYDLPEFEQAERFASIAVGTALPFTEHLDDYGASLHGKEQKTIDQRKARIQKFAEDFPKVQDVTRKKVQKWVNDQAAEGRSPKTIQGYVSDVRSYWNYLISIEAVPEESAPFDKLSLPRASSKGRADDRRAPYTPKDAVRVYRAALAEGDALLADLILLGMHTGARIEELCSLKVEHAKDFIDIRDAKTGAGVRQVPIHPAVKDMLERRRKESSDGYVFSGLKANKYGDRSNTMSARFSRLKTDLGFGPSHVFHSFRNTLATMMENAGVLEGIAADTVGHKKQTMTYGLYSGGASLEVKQKALELVQYPWSAEGG